MSDSKLIQVGFMWDAESKAGKPYKKLNFLRSKKQFPLFASKTKSDIEYHALYVGKDEIDLMIEELNATIAFLEEAKNAPETTSSEEERF